MTSSALAEDDPAVRTVEIAEFETKAEPYLRAAEGGETVRVTEHDRIVAEIRPPRPLGRNLTSLVLARGVQEGWYTPPLDPGPLPPEDFEDSGEQEITFEQLMYDLARDREDR